MFITSDFEEIRDRMLNNTNSDVNKSEGALTNDITSPMALELEQAQQDRNLLLKIMFPQTSFGEFLDMSSQAGGVWRKEGSKAKGLVTFKGEWYIDIPKGTQVTTETGLIFETLIDGMIKPTGEVVIPVQSIENGSKYNILPNKIIALVSSIEGVTSVENTEAFKEGSEIETDVELIKRLLFQKQNPPSGGNKTDYERWAKSIDGVFTATVRTLWDGNGTVKVIVGGLDNEPVEDDVVDKVQKLLDPNKDGSGGGVAPAGATVTVVSVTPKVIDIVISSLLLEDGYTLDQVKINILKEFSKYFEDYRGNIVRVREIESILIDAPGVLDFDTVKLNGERKNITVTDDERGTLGGITYE